MNRLEQTFLRLRSSGDKALAVYIMANDPDYATTLELMHTLAAMGADIIELGFPFSDPMADGPVIQQAAIRSLASGGSLRGALGIMKEFRGTDQSTPVILMGYLNPVLRYPDFAQNAKVAGADGVIIVDLPPEEHELDADFKAAKLPHIKLIAPTTSEARLQEIASSAEGFVYYVSVAGVTGVKAADEEMVKQRAQQIRSIAKVPVMVGFGIKSPEQASVLGAYVDGVVIGSVIVEKIKGLSSITAANRGRLIAELSDLTRDIKSALSGS